MVFETARIIAIESKGLWVETIPHSACGSCHAQKGCGQRLLSKSGVVTSQLWVLLNGCDSSDYHVGEEIKISVPENVIVQGALFIYMVPLIVMLVTISIAHYLAASDAFSAVSALFGLLLGAAIVRFRAYQTRFDTRLQPLLVSNQKTVSAVSASLVEL